MTLPSFAELGLGEPFLAPLADAGYHTPTPIQAQAIPHVLDERDIVGIAQTGTGKTAAFVLPLLDLLDQFEDRAQPKGVRALILAPTRELALQIAETVDRFGTPLDLTHAVVFGGVGHQPQIKALARGVDVLVACPGRLLDLMAERHVRLDRVHHLVLDEADRMLDMGFLKDVERVIAATPAKSRQTLLFSATMPGEIAALASRHLRNPVRVEVTPEVVTVEKIDQTIYAVPTARKRAVLVSLLADSAMSRVVVFTRTKHGANRLTEQLGKSGITADAIHANKSQNARQRALEGFREGEVRVLVATDIAARGIDVDGITHVVNFDMPMEPESYVHRIGRTARAGKSGAAISLCDPSERGQLKAIERLTRLSLTPVPFEGELAAVEAETERAPRPAGHHAAGRGHRGGGGQRRGGGHGGRPSGERRRARG